MFSRSLLLRSAVIAFAVTGTLFGTTACSKKAKPEVRLARTSSGSELGGDGSATFGSSNWQPNGAPGALDGSGSGTGIAGGPGSGAWSGSAATDGTGSYLNNAGTAGVENGAYIADLEMIHFAYDSADITDEWKAVLVEHAAWLNQNRTMSVQIEGHCDERGTEEYNVALGQRRADAVRQFLIDNGVDPNRLSTLSYGKMKPLNSDGSEAAMALNRRAMFLGFTGSAQMANAQ